MANSGLGYNPHLDLTIGRENKQLHEIAREVLLKSPATRDIITLSDEYNATKEKEFVGLGFNRYVMDGLKNRWDKLEQAQANLKRAMLFMKVPLDELSAKNKQLAKDSAKDRVQVLVLGCRIRQYEGLIFNLECYLETLKDMIEYYRPYKNFMRQCAEKMRFQNEMLILYRYDTLSIVKKEMVEGQLAGFNKMEALRQKLAQIKIDNEKMNLKLSNEMCILIQKQYDMAKANVNFELALNLAMAESSETARSLFRTVSGIRKLYDTFDRYKAIDKPTFDPFEMMNVIHWRFLNIQSAIDDIYRLTEEENLQGIIPESNAPTKYRNIDPEDNLLNLNEAELKSNKWDNQHAMKTGKNKNRMAYKRSKFPRATRATKASVMTPMTPMTNTSSQVLAVNKSTSKLTVGNSRSTLPRGKLSPIPK